MQKYSDLKTIVDSIEDDVLKFYEFGDSDASIKVKEKMDKIKELTEEIKEEINDLMGGEEDGISK